MGALSLPLLQPAIDFNLLHIPFVRYARHLPGADTTALLGGLLVLVEVDAFVFIVCGPLVSFFLLRVPFVACGCKFSLVNAQWQVLVEVLLLSFLGLCVL